MANNSIWIARDEWGTYVYSHKPEFAFDGTLLEVNRECQIIGDSAPNIKKGQCVEYVPKDTKNVGESPTQ